MEKISWDTEKTVDSFIEEMQYIEAVTKYLGKDDEDYYLGYDFDREVVIESMWEKWDKLKLAFEDEFGVRL